MSKSFLVLFFKKELLPSYPATALRALRDGVAGRSP